MKKLVIALVVLLVIVVGSPAVIGSIAENAMQENLGWAAGQAGSGELNVSAEDFEKGWFSSTGRYRVEIGDGQLQASLLDAFEQGESDALPYLLVDTKLDHGVLPLSTLKPGLGSAVSTMSLVDPSGDVVEIPGVIYSDIGFSGFVNSVYELEAGSADFGDAVATWQDALVTVGNSPTSGRVTLDAATEGFSIDGADGNVTISGVTIVSDQAPTAAGFFVGSTDVRIDSIEASEAGAPGVAVGPIIVKGVTAANGDLIDGDTQMSMNMSGLPMVGNLMIDIDIAATGVHGVAATNIGDAMSLVDDNAPPDVVYGLIEKDLMTLFENGFVVDFRKFNVETDLGLTDSSMKVTVPAMEPGFTWPEVMQALTAEAKMSVPAALMDMAVAMNPQANAAIMTGFLKRDGDVYKLEAQYAQGLMTINGAPMPLPIPGVNPGS